MSAEDTACTALFEQAAAQLAAEQYPRMLRIANDRMHLCPGPESALLVGLAQANMVDSLAVTDPAEREQYRQSALRNLRIAAAGGTLEPMLEQEAAGIALRMPAPRPRYAAIPKRIGPAVPRARLRLGHRHRRSDHGRRIRIVRSRGQVDHTRRWRACSMMAATAA